MSDKVFNARVQLKRDTSANWAQATNFSPKLGEPVYYTDLNKIKIGDGTTNVNNLPFVEVSHADSAATIDATPSLATSEKYITVTVGGKTSSELLVPFASSSQDATNSARIKSYENYPAGEAIPAQHIIALGENNKWIPLTTSTGTKITSTKTPNTKKFNPEYLRIYYGNSSVTSESIPSPSAVYSIAYLNNTNVTYRNFYASAPSRIKSKRIFLKGTYSNGWFTLDTTSDTSWFVLAPSSVSDLNSYFTTGSYYISLMNTDENNYCSFSGENSVYYFDGTNLLKCDDKSDIANTANTANTSNGLNYLTTAPTAANVDGNIKFVILNSEPSTKYDGYLYIIKSGGTLSDLTGTTWQFNSTIPLHSGVVNQWSVNFTTQESTITNCTGISFLGGYESTYDRISYISGERYYPVYGYSGNYWEFGGVKTVTFTGGRDANSSSLIAFMQECATQVS